MDLLRPEMVLHCLECEVKELYKKLQNPSITPAEKIAIKISLNRTYGRLTKERDRKVQN